MSRLSAARRLLLRCPAGLRADRTAAGATGVEAVVGGRRRNGRGISQYECWGGNTAPGTGRSIATMEDVESMMPRGCSCPFDAVVIDDIQAAGPRFDPPSLLRPGGTVVLVGDPRQLAPAVLSRGAAARRLSRSMFERLQTAPGASPLVQCKCIRIFEPRPTLLRRSVGGRMHGGGSTRGASSDVKLWTLRRFRRRRGCRTTRIAARL